MDTTEKYISMCVEATEIQEGYEPQIGDYAVRACEYNSYNVGLVAWRYEQHNLWWMLLDGWDGITLKNGQSDFYEKLLWIPRQDQLQKLAKTCECNDPLCLNIDFAGFLRDLPCPAPEGSDSFEQLWMSFMMKIRYNKIWDGKSWVMKDCK